MPYYYRLAPMKGWMTMNEHLDGNALACLLAIMAVTFGALMLLQVLSG